MRAKEGRSLWGRISRPRSKVSGEAQPKRARGLKTLWGQEFNLVKGGLEEVQVVAYVEELNSRHSAEVERLQQPGSVSELAGKVIYEAEKLAEGIKEEERKRAAEEAAKLIYQAELRSEQITDDAERAAALRLQEATRLSIAVVGKAREKTTLAEEGTRQQLPQHMADIQATLQAAIDQAYQKILADLVGLESDIQSREANRRQWPTEVIKADATPVESHVENMEEESQPAGALPAEQAPVESLVVVMEEEPRSPENIQVETTPVASLPEETKDQPQVSGGSIPAPTPVGDRIIAEEVESHEGKAFEGEEAHPGLSESAWHELSSPLDGAKEKEQEEDYDSLGRDDVREKILESLQQVIELNGHGETFAENGTATMDEEKMSPDPVPEIMARNGNGANGDGPKATSDLFEGDLEFVMPPQKDGDEPPSHLALLSALYIAVKSVPGASVLGTGGSEAEGNSISVHFESPVCLDEVLKDVKMWEEERQDNGATRSRSLLGRLKSGKGPEDSQRKRILVTL